MVPFVSLRNRPASTQWELLPPLNAAGISGVCVWYWPPSSPDSIVVSFAAVANQFKGLASLPVTMAELLWASGIGLGQISRISLFGGEWQSASVFPPYLHQPLPHPGEAGRWEILFQLLSETQIAEAPPVGSEDFDEYSEDLFDDSSPWGTASAAGQPMTEGMMFERIEAAWKTCLQVERQLQGVRQKLAAMIASLGKMDRDLTPDERLASDREDRDAWSDARRWLRDLSAKCHRELKSYDIGITSGAGRRHWMEETFQQVIQPRVATAELDRFQREFETYRRDMINLQKSMVAALQAGSQNGTQRAQRVLGIIAGKIRERRARNREALGGMNIDKSCRSKKR